SPLGGAFNFTAPVIVDSFKVAKGYVSPPAITTKITTDSNDFWVAYNRPDSGEVLVLMDSVRTVPPIRKKYFWMWNKLYVKNVSIATHKENDTVHIAFEEHNNSAGDQINYIKGFLDNNQNIATSEKR